MQNHRRKSTESGRQRMLLLGRWTGKKRGNRCWSCGMDGRIGTYISRWVHLLVLRQAREMQSEQGDTQKRQYRKDCIFPAIRYNIVINCYKNFRVDHSSCNWMTGSFFALKETRVEKQPAEFGCLYIATKWEAGRKRLLFLHQKGEKRWMQKE